MVKKLLVILFLFINYNLWADTYYVATTGDDGDPGTLAEPWLTWNYAFNQLSAGDTLFIRGGTYNTTGLAGGGNWCGVYVSNSDGTLGNEIVVSAYWNGNAYEEPRLDCSTFDDEPDFRYGVLLSGCDYWHIIGLTVQGVPDKTGNLRAYGFSIQSSNYITYYNCVGRYNGGPGFAINGFCDYSIYLYCDAYSNYDENCRQGEDADGFIASHYGSSGGYHTYYYRCRAWNNSDDGFDRLTSEGEGENDGGYFVWNQCWSWDNGYGTNGDGWGFKLESASGYETGYPVQQILVNCLSFYNKAGGLSVNEGGRVQTLIYNNTIYHNGSQGIYSDDDEAVHYFYNNISFDNGASNYVDQSNFTDANNTWNSISVDALDFVTLDTTGVSGARDIGWNLPDLSVFKLEEGSNLIDAGTISLTFPAYFTDYFGAYPAYNDDAYDLGAYEFGEEIVIPPSTQTGIVKYKRGDTWVPVISGNKLIIKNE